MTLALLNDKSDPVVLWGMKSAKAVLPWALGLPNPERLPDAIVAAVKARPKSGPLVQEAYEALELRDQNLNPPNVAIVVPRILDIVEFRNAQYIVGIPEEPLHENGATLFVSAGDVWSKQDKALQVRTMQQLLDLFGLSCHRAAASARSEREQLIEVIKQTARAMWVVGGHLKSEPLKAALAEATKVNPGIGNEELKSYPAEAFAAISNIEQFKDKIKPPPTINPPAAAK
jgi:hypothetical protein